MNSTTRVAARGGGGRSGGRRIIALSLLAGSTAVAALPGAAAPQDAAGWNSPRAQSLMQMARERRRQPLADTLLQNYQSHAEGVVYFYLDRRDTDERVLVRTDQVALEVYWAQPNRTKQRIVGLRDESSLPNRMYYHLDHLTVVQNGFGDIMRMGDGDEVRDVPHPAAPGSDSVYEFRLADSLELRLPGAPAPVKAYEIQVRPRRTDRSAIVGSVFVDHLTGDIVRMTFTFTPVSYVDRRLDFINISLDNSLWQGRYWLPYEQAVEIRRQVPELDFVVTSVIQGRFRVWDYRFNQDLPESLFLGYPVVAVPTAQRETFAFDKGIYEDLHDAGLAPPPELADLRVRAAALVRQQALSGLPRLRFSLPAASSALRFGRAEGLFLGWGGSFTAGAASRLELAGGYAFGAAHPVAVATVRQGDGEPQRIRLTAFAHEPRDLGVKPAVPGALNTLTSLWGDDGTDLFFATGARAAIERRLGGNWGLEIRAAAERHEAAHLVHDTPPLSDAAFRPVLRVDEGTMLSGRLAFGRTLREKAGLSWGARLAIEAGTFESEGYAVPRFDLSLRRGSFDRRGVAELAVTGGFVLGTPPAQSLFLLGGRNTLPGHPHRGYAGDRFALANLELARDLWPPFVRGRAFAAAGWTDGLDRRRVFDPLTPASWNVAEASAVRGSLGAGVGLLWDLLRIDFARGLGAGGGTRLLVSIDPRVWPIL